MRGPSMMLRRRAGRTSCTRCWRFFGGGRSRLGHLAPSQRDVLGVSRRRHLSSGTKFLFEDPLSPPPLVQQLRKSLPAEGAVLQRRLTASRGLQDVLVALEQGGDPTNWRPMTLATAWHRLALYRATGPADLRNECQAAVERLARAHEDNCEDWPDNEGEGVAFDDFEPRQIATVLYAWGKLRLRKKELLQKACTRAEDVLPFFEAQGLSNIIYALALLAFKHDRLLKGACDKAAENLGRFNEQGLSNTVYALGLLGFKHGALLQVYGFGLLRWSHDGFLRAFCQHLPERLHDFSEQQLSNIVYALGVLGYRHNAFLKSFCLILPSRLHKFSTQGIANTVYALGLLEFRNLTCLHAVAKHMPDRLDGFTTQGISNVVYTMGCLQFSHPKFLGDAGINIAKRLDECSEQDIWNIFYALGLLEYKHDELLQALATHSPFRIFSSRLTALVLAPPAGCVPSKHAAVGDDTEGNDGTHKADVQEAAAKHPFMTRFVFVA